MKQHILTSLAVMLILLLPATVWAQAARTVSGTVSDELGEPLIGVSVTLPGRTGGVTTDIDGNYQIAVPAGVSKIAFSYVGYNTLETEITSNRLDVSLEPSSQSLQEMVVIGYGTTKKNDLTGSVSAISEKDFNKGVISSPEELINGKIAGVQITSAGGSPNAGLERPSHRTRRCAYGSRRWRGRLRQLPQPHQPQRH